MKGAISIAFLALAVIAGAQSSAYVGTYEVVLFDKGKPMVNSKLPPGQVFVAELLKNGTWSMANMLSGWDGKWSLKGGKLVLVTASGPSGKPKTPETMVFLPKPDRSRLVCVGPKQKATVMEWHFDPKARQKLAKRMDEALKR